MPTPRPLKSYPPEYFTIFSTAIERYRGGEELRLPMDSKDEAKQLRTHLYAYRTALSYEPEKQPELALLIHLVRMRVTQVAGKWYLKLYMDTYNADISTPQSGDSIRPQVPDARGLNDDGGA